MAFVAALGILGFVGAFAWVAIRPAPSAQPAGADGAPTASISENLSDGRLDVEVFALGNRDVRLEIRFQPDAGTVAAAGGDPEVSVAMVGMQMGSIDPPLQQVEPGVWQADLSVAMAGRWIAYVGFDEQFAEVEFDAN